MKTLRVYLSHAISNGGKLTNEIMEQNCLRAIKFTEQLEEKCPSTSIYCPARYEDFVHRAYAMKLLSIPQILKVDCEILKDCDVLLVYSPDGKISKGMQVEIDFAKKHKITTVYWWTN